jgi:GntR family transcriptional repressor for pyruvate dehydrogenase complex
MKTKKKTSWVIRNSDIKYRNLYEQIADSVEEMIFEGGADDMRLPTEAELTEKYDVSRSVIREALKILNERGLVSMRAGDGSYVNIPKAAAISRVLGRVMRFNRVSDDKITEVRMLLETKTAEEAARNATDEDIALLEDLNRQMELHHDDLEIRVNKDCEFHTAIAKTSRNELLEFMVESITDLLKGYIKQRIALNTGGSEGGIKYHKRIIKAIKSHDSKKAKLLMKGHIEESFYVLGQK